MRDLLERSRPARVAVAVVAGCCVLALAQAAAAHNDLDMREVFRVPAPVPAPAAASQAAAPTSVSRRQPAARPLRVALARPQRRDRHEAERKAAPAPRRSATMTAARGSPALRVAALPPSRDELFEPVPQKPAIVSIYADQTLRRGDAVVMGNGLRIFGGRETGLHQPADFVPLTRAPSLEWHLRRTLSAFDNNPPDRWPS